MQAACSVKFAPAHNKASGGNRRPRGAVARATFDGETAVVVDKPLGLTLAAKSGGDGVYAKSVKGNARDAGIKEGDTILYTASYFGDELWPADNLAAVRTTLTATASPVDIVIVPKGVKSSVKGLQKRKNPARFGRKLSAKQKETATHICLDCGYVYFGKKPFDTLPNSYLCPQCAAPKRRFATYDPETGKVTGKAEFPTVAVLGTLAGFASIAYAFTQAAKLNAFN